MADLGCLDTYRVSGSDKRGFRCDFTAGCAHITSKSFNQNRLFNYHHKVTEKQKLKKRRLTEYLKLFRGVFACNWTLLINKKEYSTIDFNIAKLIPKKIKNVFDSLSCC